MRFTTHQVRESTDFRDVFLVFDSLDDRYLAGFDHYPSPSYTVVVAHGRNSPQGVAVLIGNIITAFVVFSDVSQRRDIQVWDGLIGTCKPCTTGSSSTMLITQSLGRSRALWRLHHPRASPSRYILQPGASYRLHSP
jgi:hypothetical protein